MRGVQRSNIGRQVAELINACINVDKKLFAADGQRRGDDRVTTSNN
jgi:hypothetical protein